MVKFMCAASWLLGLCLASLPVIVPDWEVYSRHSICIGLPLNSESYPGSGYGVAIFLGVNSVLFLIIAAGQLATNRVIWTNSKKAGLVGEQARRRLHRDMIVARKLFAIALTDFACWFPICIMGFIAHMGYTIPDAAYAWTAVVALPINSSINPFLYNGHNVFSTIVKKYRNSTFFRSHHECSCKQIYTVGIKNSVQFSSHNCKKHRKKNSGGKSL